MTQSVPAGEVRPLGDRALLIGVGDASAARALAGPLAEALSAAGVAAEVVCGFATVGVVLGDDEADLTEARVVARGTVADVASSPRPTSGDSEGRVVTVPCTFDGPDLDEVAALARCTPAEVVSQLTAAPLRVAVLGFAPGFAYLDGLPAALASVPRRPEPRPRVAAGSVALANGHAAVYPTATPGGWQLVGRTGYPLVSTRPPYAALAPGDEVRFSVAGADSGDTVEPPPLDAPAWAPPVGARAVLTVTAPGLRTLRQDGGRQGVAAAGIPGAGAADPVSFALANRLVGNAAHATTLEITAGRARFRVLAACHVALAGSDPEVRIDDAVVPGGQVVPLGPGQSLAVGALRRGGRTYLAVAGGLLGPVVFGSTASDELCRLGPGPLAAGETIWAGPWGPPLGDHLRSGAASALDPGETVSLRVVAGPHPERFAPDALAALADTVFTVGQDSNRVGLRLEAPAGAPALRRGGDEGAELDSQCVVTGAVQVPPGGDPVVLLPDHATLGGYPVVAVVALADHGVLGQCMPGTALRLCPVPMDEADDARRSARRAALDAVVGNYPVRAG
jgi:KipI family sensor histidine kinase inhibitor